MDETKVAYLEEQSSELIENDQSFQDISMFDYQYPTYSACRELATLLNSCSDQNPKLVNNEDRHVLEGQEVDSK